MDETHMQRKMEVRHFGLGMKGRDLRQNHRRPQGRSQHTMERVIGSVKYVRSLSRAGRSGCRGQKLALGARSLTARRPGDKANSLSRNFGHGSHCKGDCQI